MMTLSGQLSRAGNGNVGVLHRKILSAPTNSA
jgi:hypothetical protein